MKDLKINKKNKTIFYKNITHKYLAYSLFKNKIVIYMQRKIKEILF